MLNAASIRPPPQGFTSIPFSHSEIALAPVQYRNAEHPTILQTRWALEVAIMSRERWMLWVLLGLSAILGILLFFFG